MFKSHELVVKMEKTPKPVETSSEPSKPFPTATVSYLVKETVTHVSYAYICVKGFQTLCKAFEHVVVTKVQ